jgi:RNA polymerase sigma-70 factor
MCVQSGVACLDENFFAAYFDIQLSAADVERLFVHVDTCADCARLFHVAVHVPPDVDCVKHLRALQEDLYLACACAGEVQGAAEAFDAEFLARVDNFVAHVDSSPSFVDEIRQLLRERVLLRRPDGPPRIADYSGRGPLMSWVRISAVRVALNHRAQPQQARRVDDRAILDDLADEGSPELQLLRERYAASLLEALRKAVAALSPDQRVTLRMYFASGQSTKQIAAALCVNRSTASRRLVAAREAVFTETRRFLRETLPIESSEFESLARVLHDQLNISLRTLLAEPAR